LISEEAYRALEEAVGPENVSREPALLDGYSWQTHINSDPDIWIPRPEAVVLPASTEEVQAVVRACNEHGLKFKPFSVGWGAFAGPSREGVIQIDLRRMDRIIEIDEKNMYAVVEPYVIGAQLQAEAMKVGLNTHLIGAGPGASPLASATSLLGTGWDGIYMSSSFRNMLGVEWVLPSGEVLRVGIPGSGGEWFCGDGPGPSLRGIMRGWLGTAGSMGVFTKCAVKLFNWPGPPKPAIEGTLLDLRTEVPSNFGTYICMFPSWEKYTDAVYELGDAEIGYNQAKNSIGVLLALLVPRFLRKLSGAPALKEALRAVRHQFSLVLAGSSQREFDYQEKVLKKIVSENEGVLVDLAHIRPLQQMIWWGMIRSSLTPLIFRAMGNYNVGFAFDESFDPMVLAGKVGEELKQKWIDKGAMLDDLGDNAWMPTYENNTWTHFEELFLFDHRNPKHAEAHGKMAMEGLQFCKEKSLNPGLFLMEPKIRAMFSPLMGSYSEWQKKILATLDDGNVSDTKFYTDEA
jgi:glycolate oxidase